MCSGRLFIELLRPLCALLLQPAHCPNTLPPARPPARRGRGEPASPCLEEWIEIFRHSIGSFQRTAAADPSVPEAERAERAARFAAEYAAKLDALEAQGAAWRERGGADAPPVTCCLELCQLR